MKNYQMWFILLVDPLFAHRYNTKGYQFVGVDEDGKLIYRKQWVMQFRSHEEADRYMDEYNRLAPPYRYIVESICMTL